MNPDKNKTHNLWKSVKFFNQFDAQILMACLNKKTQMLYLVLIFHGNHTKILARVS